MALSSSISDDPLYAAQNKAGLDILGLYNPEQEQQRYDKALGQLQQTIAERQARSGLTGSSEEKDALTNAANNFELGWAERKPKQLSEAITASNLPIGNLLRGQNIDQAQQVINQGKLNSLAGGAASLAKYLFPNGVSDIFKAGTSMASGGKALYDLLFSGGSNGGGVAGLINGQPITWNDISANPELVYAISQGAGGSISPGTDDWSWLLDNGGSASDLGTALASSGGSTVPDILDLDWSW